MWWLRIKKMRGGVAYIMPMGEDEDEDGDEEGDKVMRKEMRRVSRRMRRVIRRVKMRRVMRRGIRRMMIVAAFRHNFPRGQKWLRAVSILRLLSIDEKKRERGQSITHSLVQSG